MPVYEYKLADGCTGCAFCRAGFEVLRAMSDPPLLMCPECGDTVRKVYSAPAIGGSNSGFDDRAKNAGFHKLRRLGKGEYEKQY